MSPGAMPQLRPLPKRRTLPYTRRPRAARKRDVDRTRSPGNTGIVLFHLPYDFPVATMRAKRIDAGVVRAAIDRWATARWAWLKPRTVPAIVALAALAGLLLVTQHLTDLAQHGSPTATAPVIVSVPAAP